MATKFRTMLAPIDLSTGDGRRFKSGAIELASTPFPFEWVQSREGGHDGAVTVGAVHSAEIQSVKYALEQGWATPDEIKAAGLSKDDVGVWALGVMFDDVDRDELPTLAENVAHSMHLIESGVLGPSVDLDSFEGLAVKEGTDEEVTWEMIEEAELSGEELKVELLITAGRVRAATLVSIPAFAETPRPLALFTEEGDDAESVANTASLIASIAAPTRRPPATAFEPPELTGPTPITYDWERGQVYGHIGLKGTCHTGFADVCVTLPDEPDDYAWFNRYPVETEDGGLTWAGRLTVGGHHADLSLTASGAMAVHDAKITAAHVVARKDAFGIVVAGPINPELDERAKGILSRRKVSGDWRETPSGLSLVELLALAPGPRRLSEPGFPVATHVARGRQTALTASLGPDANLPRVTDPMAASAIEAAMDRVLQRRELALATQRERETARAALQAEVERADQDVAAEARGALAELLREGE
jgi:hypothetical protein